MSSDLRRKTSGRKPEHSNHSHGSYVSVEDNLGKLGFLAEPKKKSSKSDRNKARGSSDPSESNSKIHRQCFERHGCFLKHCFPHRMQDILTFLNQAIDQVRAILIDQVAALLLQDRLRINLPKAWHQFWI
jgi:hypothetical protein